MIATSQPLASAAGLRVMQEGGNAIDAAVAAAAVLAVVEPSMTGIGGDLFAIVYDAKTKTLKALNASGRSGRRSDTRRVCQTRGDESATGRGALGHRSGRGGRLVRASLEVRHGADVARRRAGDRLREERIPGVRDHQPPVEIGRAEARRRSAGFGSLSAERPGTGGRRDFRQPEAGGDARAHRQRWTRCFLQGPHREGDRRGHEAAERSPGRGRLRRTQGRLGRSDLHEVPRVRHLRDAARTRRGSWCSRCSTSSKAST